MLEKLEQHINQKLSFLKDKKLLIAISGGVDSVVLTHLLHALNFDISLAHCNFNLRATESDKDEEFVKKIGENLHLKTFTTSFETKKYAEKNQLSTQVAARNLRYNWFQEIIQKHHFDFLLTAHHADDNLETFIINLTRGTGLEGLTGIPEVNQHIVRPLLIFSRDEIEKYAVQHHIKWREDLSNASSKYVRNKIRHEVIPILKEINPSLLESFQKTSDHLQESQQLIDESISDFKKKGVVTQENETLKIDIAKIIETKNSKAYLYQLLKEFGFTEWNDVTHLLKAQSGKEVFSKTHRLLKNRDSLLLTEIKKEVSTLAYQIAENTSEITTPIHLTFDKTTDITSGSNNAIFVDIEKLVFPLTLRKWQHGDYFYPAGMQGKKKVSKYFKDEKISSLEKENTWLLCSNDAIVWVVGKRQDDRFLAKKNTVAILHIKFC